MKQMSRYNLGKLRNAVRKYKRILGGIKGKSVIVVLNYDQREAFYSLAPLSKAIDELGGDIYVEAVQGKSANLDVIKDVWTCFNDLQSGIKNKKTKALDEFIKMADAKCKAKLRKMFRPAEIFLTAGKKGFEGRGFLAYDTSWMREYREKELLETAKIIFEQVYDLGKDEKVRIGFELLRRDKELGLPIEDYLDSFQISYAMMLAVKEHEISMGSSSSRSSQLDEPERISELRATLLGCELCKDIDEPVFKKYKKVSKLLNLSRIEIPSAVFGIRGKGYSGRHYFGEFIGYPSKNRKTRWSSPGQMIYKLDYYPQTMIDTREPLARLAFTETLPIDVFIKTCKIDWLKMQKEDHEIIDMMEKCQYIEVIGKKFEKYQTRLRVELVSKDGKRRHFRPSDVETRHLIKQDLYEESGIKAGTMANIPGGEAFVTPESIIGQFIGDVVISIDQSYVLCEKNPFIVGCHGNSYKVMRAPTNILRKFEEKKKEAKRKLAEQERSNSLPKDILKINKENFNNIGEFAINTNPNAELCNYLIVNEKIANMIHIALGSGFDADRATYYHTDIVINSPRQKLDIYGVDKNGRKYWIHKKGRLVV
jgi:hypothetical protein